MPKEERVNHPQHYQTGGGIEVIDVIRHYTCDIANALKYLMRAGRKQEADMTDREKEIEDLRKALWYINDYVVNCQDETSGEAVRPTVKSMVRQLTGYSVRQITEGYDADIAKAIELTLHVGLIGCGGSVRVKYWENFLDSATTRIQHRILSLEADLLSEEIHRTRLTLQGVAVEGEDYITKPGGQRETEPDHYDPLNMITLFGRAYCLSREQRRKANGALYSPCQNCDLQEYCFDDWQKPDPTTCRHICTRLHQAETDEYYREVGTAAYRPSRGTLEVIDEQKEAALELKRLEEEAKNNS